MDFSQLWSRMVRAARLDVHLFEEVEADQNALGQAGLVVVLSSLAAGVGVASQSGLAGLLGITLATLASWAIWAYLTFFIGTRLLPEPQTHATPGELLRTIGFASSPGLIRILGLFPGLGPLINLVAGIWMLVAMVVAVRQALDYKSTWRAVGVCLIGWVVQVGLLALVFTLFGVGK